MPRGSGKHSASICAHKNFLLYQTASRINEWLFDWESTIRFNLGSFYIGLQASLKIGIHLLSNRSLDGIRTLTTHRSSWITDARDCIQLLQVTQDCFSQ